ncbi:MAG: GAF domain-containing protein, partial [Methanosarcina sp.]
MPDSAIDPQYEGLLETALQNCAAERIHEIGTIQPAGVLLAVDQDLHVRMASDNLAGLFGIAAGDALGRALAELVGAAQAETIRTFAAQESWSGSQICSISLDRDGADTRFDARLVHSDGLLVIEIENQPSGTEDAFHLQFVPIRDSLWKLDAEQDMQRYSQAVVDEVRLLSGYDRVMMYRFDYNWDGEVIAESRIDGALSYLGNHFPASDIPAQARELYTRNLVRLISDVDGESIPVLGDTPAAKPLDLSQSWLRSMSPVHVQYLRNMGVQASLSISLVQNNRLW